MNPSLPPARLGRYESKTQPGAGAMGELHLAIDAELDRTVEIIFPAALVSNQQRLPRFIGGAQAASA